MPEDTEAALEWAEYQASLCSGCANPRAESFNPNGPTYVGEALRCRACAARETVVRRWRDDNNADPGGVFFTVHESR